MAITISSRATTATLATVIGCGLLLSVHAGCASRNVPPPVTSGPITEQVRTRTPAIATDPAFSERRGASIPGVPAFPAYPGATLGGSATRNREGAPGRGFRIVWSTRDPASAVVAFYQKTLPGLGWTFRPPSDGVSVEQHATIANDALKGAIDVEEEFGETTIIVTLGPLSPAPQAVPSAALGEGGPLFAAASGAFTFGVAGDFTLNEHFLATVAKVKETKPDLFLALGDLSYTAGGEQEWCGRWAEAPAFTQLLLIAGNHDTGESKGGDIEKYIQHCGPPAGVAIPTGHNYGRQYFVDFPAVSPLARFIMLTPGIKGNTGGVNTDYKKGSPGYNFTAQAIDQARAAGINWIFVGMHKNYVSVMEKGNEVSTDNKSTFMAMLLDKRVDVIFQGHEHGYERTKQLATDPSRCPILPTNTVTPACIVDSDDTLVKGRGTVIHVLGTGGKDMRGFDNSDSERLYFTDRFAHSDHEAFGFGLFTVTPTSLTYTFVRSGGAAFSDSFKIVISEVP